MKQAATVGTIPDIFIEHFFLLAIFAIFFHIIVMHAS
jgi:hypothetical protein